MARSTTFSVPLWDITSRVTKELLCPTRHEQRITWVTSLPWQALMSSRTSAVLRLTCDACKPQRAGTHRWLPRSPGHADCRGNRWGDGPTAP